MTIREVIAYVDAVHDNSFSDTVKYRWISECEARLWAEVLLLPLSEFRAFAPAIDGDQILCAPAPYDELYTAYLGAKLYLAYHEHEAYQNTMALFNSLLDGYSIWYNQHYDPARGEGMPLGQYPLLVQGESAVLELDLPVLPESLEALKIILKTGEYIREYAMEDCAFDGKRAVLELSQEETLSLPVGVAAVSIVGLHTGGQRFECYPSLALRIAPTAYGEVLA